MPREALLNQAAASMLAGDVALLNEHGVGDGIMMSLAAEHAARVEALCKAVSPTAGRALLVTLCTALLGVAKRIEGMSFQEPELVNV